ncbi:calcium-binding protein, partial [Nostoc sp. NIES-2111]
MPTTYKLTPSATTIDEGKTLTFSLTTTNLPAGTKIPYTLSGIDIKDLTSGGLTGVATLDSNGKAIITVKLASDQKTEGNETLTLKLNNGQASSAVTIKDTSLTPPPTYKLTPSATTIDEGKTLTFSLTTTNLPTGTKIPYTLSGIDIKDLASGGLTGVATLDSNGKAIIEVKLAADKKTEGNETLTLKLNNGKASSVVTIKDTSFSTAPTYQLSSSATKVGEEDVVTVTLKTSNVPVGTRLDYKIFGEGINASDFLTPLLSYFVVGNDGSAKIQIKLNSDRTTENVENFTLKLNNNQASVSIQINDTSQTPIPSISIVPVTAAVNEGDTAIFRIFTQNIYAGTELQYTLFGTDGSSITPEDVVGGKLSGVVTVNANGEADILLPIARDRKYDGGPSKLAIENLSIVIRNNVNGIDRGDVISSSPIQIFDTSTPEILGTDANDTIVGTSGIDYIWGFQGNDVIDGGDGDDYLQGNEGIDILRGGAGNDTLFTGDNNAADTGKWNPELAYGGSGDDYIVGSKPTNGNDFKSNYEFYGEDGNDTIFGGAGFGIIDGGDGNDILYAYHGYDGNISGGKGDDIIYAGYFHGISGGSGYDRAYLLGNLNDFSLERNSDESGIGLNLRSNYTTPDGRKLYYFITDVEELVFADGIVRKTEQIIKEQNVLWPGLSDTKPISFNLQSTGQSVIKNLPTLELNSIKGAYIDKSVNTTLLGFGNSRLGAKIDANMSINAGIEAFALGKFSLGTIDTFLPTTGSVFLGRNGTEVTIYPDFDLLPSAHYQVKNPEAFFKAGLRGYFQANASLTAAGWLDIPSVSAWGIQITPAIKERFTKTWSLPSNLSQKYSFEKNLIDLNLGNPAYTQPFPYGQLVAEIPLISFNNQNLYQSSATLSGRGSDSILSANFDVASFIADKLPIPLAYEFKDKYSTPSLFGYQASLDINAKATILSANLIATASLVEDITVKLKGFKADVTIDGVAGPQDLLLSDNGTTQFDGFYDFNGDGYYSIGMTLEPIVEITNHT